MATAENAMSAIWSWGVAPSHGTVASVVALHTRRDLNVDAIRPKDAPTLSSCDREVTHMMVGTMATTAPFVRPIILLQLMTGEVEQESHHGLSMQRDNET